MIDFIKKSIAAAFAIITGVFTFVPESAFASHVWITQGLLNECEWLSDFEATDVDVVITRLACFYWFGLLHLQRMRFFLHSADGLQFVGRITPFGWSMAISSRNVTVSG